MSEFEQMTAGDDGWTEWVHPTPGYRMKCCDCGLVHRMEFAIADPALSTDAEPGPLNEGEGSRGVIIFRAARDDTSSSEPPEPDRN